MKGRLLSTPGFVRNLSKRHSSRKGLSFERWRPVALNVYNLFGPPPAAFMEVFGLAMVSYLGLAGVAFWLNGLRPPADEPGT
ncbi:MAG: hypothetical protein GWP16_04855 [Nitrospirae bacterium]|nr:hypothetical protein [Nitrospirota bacterium]